MVPLPSSRVRCPIEPVLTTIAVQAIFVYGSGMFSHNTASTEVANGKKKIKCAFAGGGVRLRLNTKKIIMVREWGH
jgi:hypothetical protein